MYGIIREPDEYRIDYGEETQGASLRFVVKDGLKIFLRASGCTVMRVILRWREKTEGPVLVLGDEWERTYGNTQWQGIVPERAMPWYVLVSRGDRTCGIGVTVRPNAMCHWQLDPGGVTLVLDVRNGARGVRLDGRELELAEAVTAEYEGISPFEAAKRFCARMSPSPVLPKEPVYGSNNWYYAYGDSSHEEILRDSEFVSEMTKGVGNRPYMVVDDGWSPNMTCGPWDRGNEKFPDMRRLAREMAQTGVKPGIWIRALYDDSPFSASGHTLPGRPKTLDPSDPAVLSYVTETVLRLRDWGFRLVKHDYSSIDIFGIWGVCGRALPIPEDRVFLDQGKTTAQIAKQLYDTIFAAAGDMIVLGCNCVNHLCVGSVHLNRIGDDTSGVAWERTRKMGVNTLGFRLCQDGSFFKVDADCVGLTAAIPWELNRQWMELIAKSGTPLFVSAKIDDVTEEMKPALREAFALAAVQKADCEPLDWTYNRAPALWRFGSETKRFDFDDRFGAV